jgi:hypothetical protein
MLNSVEILFIWGASCIPNPRRPPVKQNSKDVVLTTFYLDLCSDHHLSPNATVSFSNTCSVLDEITFSEGTVQNEVMISVFFQSVKFVQL